LAVSFAIFQKHNLLHLLHQPSASPEFCYIRYFYYNSNMLARI
jgi:hypothetical protein